MQRLTPLWLLSLTACLPTIPEAEDTSSGDTSVAPLVLQSLSAGAFHTCGLDMSNQVICWGDDSEGQSTYPGSLLSSVSAGELHTCGIKPNNES
jgi:hypothetical protein